eukprot:TRINITY_DN470_c0_g1_i1.p1 TRINITY_DN470_c0_g1~~TRINITY_DN470_c0_g1_i1.p1  ORF type:complete len:774 (-),score=221.36 TRINITY_DN470_c0_g1_i1:8-2329(-)
MYKRKDDAVEAEFLQDRRPQQQQRQTEVILEDVSVQRPEIRSSDGNFVRMEDEQTNDEEANDRLEMRDMDVVEKEKKMMDIMKNYINKDESLKIDEETYRANMRKKEVEAYGDAMVLFGRWVAPRSLAMLIRNSWIYLFLLVLGAIAGGLSTAMDIAIKELRLSQTLFANLSSNFYVSYLLWIIFGIVVGTSAALFTDFVSPYAIGSGIPEVKCILNGVGTMGRYLSIKTLFAKVFGLVMAIGSGLFVGKEGPFIHCSAMIAHFLFKVFRPIRANKPLMAQLLGAASATGVSAHFGAILGGVLYSIEVTAAYYPVRNYWFSALSCAIGGILFRTLTNTYLGHPNYFLPIVPNGFDNDLYFSGTDTAVFILIGITCGLWSVLFVKLNAQILMLRRKTVAKFPRILGPIPYTFIIVLVVSILTFPGIMGNYTSMGGYNTLADLFNIHPFGVQDAHLKFKSTDWTKGRSPFQNLIWFFVMKYLLTSLSITCATPGGLFVPTLILGAGWGRLIGEFMNEIMGMNVLSGGFAVVGAAAMTGGITQTYSTAVIVLELTGQLEFLIPVIISITLSIGVAKLFTISIFSNIARIRGLPFLDELKYWKYGIKAEDIMHKEFVFIPQTISLQHAAYVLAACPNDDFFPVVENKDNMMLVGTVPRESIRKEIAKRLGLDDKPVEVAPNNPTAIVHRIRDSVIVNKVRPKPIDVDLVTSNVDESEMITLEVDEVTTNFRPGTPLTEAHLLFVTMRLHSAFVLHHGKLVGIMTRDKLREALLGWFG